MPDLQQPLMIITDLDGSLLDHHSYRWDAATEWLTTLKQRAIPLVICSSKTAAEIIPLQKRLGIAGAPFIAENGAVVERDGQRTRLPDNTLTYDALCTRLAELQTTYRFTGFHDFTEQEVSSMTGLTESEAALARQRDASEVVVWRDSDEAFDRFREALSADGLMLAQGGRFWHVMPAGSGKGEAVRWLLAQQPVEGRITIGLGDGPNDAPMLDAVDYAVVIKGYSKTPVTLSRTDQQQVYHTAHYGPEGWREGLDYFLTQPQ
ncbi:mannosyl-3-phosphoglycerate phosphatase [Pantoea conspicua]|uniref:Mannosyl-3-phosphoglycerate phosphatase n=1 Tax=Pantoea conspicua TaxID=472705 RepID=A0A1X1BSM2_9GAMM|nr:mannosyl-3-phosphoglycerate phosphatase-related protein [Pantoea conspicua]ORM51193.1 mannosyl-3-phosphoglycerate phosphatase [Pantoea conspicua]